MTNREKEIIIKTVNTLKELQKDFPKDKLVKYLDYNIIMMKTLNYSDEFMEKLYFIRYYYNIGGVFND